MYVYTCRFNWTCEGIYLLIKYHSGYLNCNIIIIILYSVQNLCTTHIYHAFALHILLPNITLAYIMAYRRSPKILMEIY